VRNLKPAGVTVVVVTHRTPLLAAMDKVILLRDGVIEKQGAVADGLGPARPRLAEAGGHEAPAQAAIKSG